MPTPEPSHPPTAVRSHFAHVCDRSCGDARRDGSVVEVGALCAALAAGALARGALPPQLTLCAPAALPYATLLGALSAAHARGVRQARVVVQIPGIPYPAQ